MRTPSKPRINLSNFRVTSQDFSLFNITLLATRGFFRQIFCYFGVSAIALAADFATMIFLKECRGLDYVSSAAVGLLFGTSVHYYLAKCIVFPTRRLSSKVVEFIAYGALGGIAMLVSLAIILVLTELVGLDYRISKIPAVAVSFVLGFILRKRLLFDERTTLIANGVENGTLIRQHKLLEPF